MKIKLINVRISYPDLFEPGKKFGKYGAPFLFSAKSGVKEQIGNEIDAQGEIAFGAKWPAVKKDLTARNKIVRIKDGADEGYEEDYYIRLSGNSRPDVRGRKGEVITAKDGIIYSGCNVDVWVDVSAYKHSEFGPVVSVKLLGVQFRSDNTPFSTSPRTTDSDYEDLTKGIDDGDL